MGSITNRLLEMTNSGAGDGSSPMACKAWDRSRLLHAELVKEIAPRMLSSAKNRYRISLPTVVRRPR